MPSETRSSIRCAIYTRKSSEEGLEQSFNSLQAQREACCAFILSQTHEGWRALPTLYDDGGYSGGTIERPALQKLLEDIRAQKIDTVVVYKVDRLTRSLADFAKIIETFDASKVSFVSVTQQFNMTTSMGRLTLNVLLSFAQFEREVTGERIRDKIAASKRKGMWMGGNVPLGYETKERQLLVNSAEATVVRLIYRRYLELGCVSKLKVYLEQKDIRSKVRISQNGKRTGGTRFSRGALYAILRNRIYLGEIEHHGQIHPGQHQGIIQRDLWEKVQAQLQANLRAHRNNSRAAEPSLLVGLMYDELGNRFTPSHTVKDGKRYRYYVSQVAVKNPGLRLAGPVRVPAGEIEGLITSRIRAFLESRSDLARILPRNKDAHIVETIIGDAQKWAGRLTAAGDTRNIVRRLIARIVVRRHAVELFLDKDVLLEQLLRRPLPKRAAEVAKQNRLKLVVDANLERCKGEVTLIQPGKVGGQDRVEPTPALIRSVARSFDWSDRVLRGELSGRRSIATAIELDERYVSRILKSAFLAPDIVESILAGQQPPKLSARDLRACLQVEWAEQRRLLGFPSK